MRALGEELVAGLGPGAIVLLEGSLGAGKTTLVRGMLEGLGHLGPVRSPTFNLLQAFSTTPPLLHADLYRLKSWQGIGIEDYLSTHICCIEWPDRAAGLVRPNSAWNVSIQFSGAGRDVVVTPPSE